VGPSPRAYSKKFFASFFQERRIFFSEEKKQKTFCYGRTVLRRVFWMVVISMG
jgi:hypothetical protein